MSKMRRSKRFFSRRASNEDSDVFSSTASMTSKGGDDTMHRVPVPAGCQPGEVFSVKVNGRELTLQCPKDAKPGQYIRFAAPNRGLDDESHRSENTNTFQVVVPNNVCGGQSFALMANGVRILVRCPESASPGSKIQFELPIGFEGVDSRRRRPKVSMIYDKDVWSRVLRISDYKFQWIRMDGQGDIDRSNRFHVDTSAFVRKLRFRPRDRPEEALSGELSFVKANKATSESKVVVNGKEILGYADIVRAQRKKYTSKVRWFRDVLKTRLEVGWDMGHMRISVRRDRLLEDSVDAVMSIKPENLRHIWSFSYIGEPGLDAGGVTRDWFQQVTEQLFDPTTGLFETNGGNQGCMQINSHSEITCGPDHLHYYRFLGRVIGKALFDRQLIAGRFVRYMYKHLLGWPIMFGDLELVDEEYYKNLKQLEAYGKKGMDIEDLCCTFSINEEMFGATKEVPLTKGGKDIMVTSDNYPEYMEACLKYKLLVRIRSQLLEMLLGFSEVFPESLLTIFDFQELELLLCGLPNIDIDDWKSNTVYRGAYQFLREKYPTCVWFWEIVTEFEREQQARLLQFVTGTAGVPSGGFGELHGRSGEMCKFTIQSVTVHQTVYPKAHTCFNRIDLPMYETKDEMEAKLKEAINLAGAGFDEE